MCDGTPTVQRHRVDNLLDIRFVNGSVHEAFESCRQTQASRLQVIGVNPNQVKRVSHIIGLTHTSAAHHARA